MRPPDVAREAPDSGASASVPSPTGALLPRVTAVLKAFFQMPSDEPAAERGRYVHRALALLLGGGDGSGLDRESLDPSLAGYVAAGEKAIEALGLKVYRVECPVWSATHRYAGHADLLGTIGERWAVVDWKTGGRAAWHQLQLAAYAQAASETGKSAWMLLRPSACWRIAVYLHADGHFALQSWRGPDLFREDLAAFLGGLQMWAWQRNHQGNGGVLAGAPRAFAAKGD